MEPVPELQLAPVSTRWQDWFRSRSPREILSRIAPGDPLRLRPRIGAFLEQRALLLEADAMQLRALALVARAAVRYRGQPELDLWLLDRIREAAEELIEDPQRSTAEASAFELLGRPLGLDPQGLRRATERFNRLPELDRQAFFGLVLRGKALESMSKEHNECATELARRARTVLLLFLEHAAGQGRLETSHATG